MPLDISFRINSIDKECEKTRMELFRFISQLILEEDTASKIPTSVKWYPQEDTVFAFKDLSRVELRQNPKLKEFHQFIVRETESGRIFR